MATIVIVEDNAANRKLLIEILKHAEHRVLEASDADSGILLVREQLPDLIMMDIHMPGTDGLTATRLLKADKLTCHIPIIAVTARAMDGDREIILEAGCDAYISKPIRYKDVLQQIEQLLKKSNSDK